ncbi:MAG: type IV secretion system DNA-binding domain-containing protein [Gammaproteobacteria bacterium]|nr:type IV secretion system DNA-binding domain-containing protein [Gammaproteobacteria bacterium]
MSENSSYQGAKKLGSDVTQQVRAVGLIIRIALLFFIICFTLASYTLNNRPEVAYSAVWLKAKYYVDVQKKPDTTVRFKLGAGRATSAHAKAILINTNILQALAIVKSNLLYALIIAIIVSLVTTFVIARFFSIYGKKAKGGSTKHIRGSVLVSERELAAEVQRQKIASDLMVGSVPLVRGAETQQIYISGAIGCGKGNTIKAFLDTICQRGQRFIIYDKSGEYVTKYYREGTDIILNPFDERMPGWSPWLECVNSFDYEMIASSFIPDSPAQKDEHWTEAPRSVLADLLAQLKSEGMDNIDDLFAYSQDKNALHDFLQGTSSAQILDPDSSEHASSILSIISPKIKSLRYLSNIKSNIRFSLREWVQNDSDTRVFITCSQRQKKSIQPLMTAWLDIVISEILSLPEDRERRLFSVIDELASLDPINSLFDGINEGRKFGLCHILSITSMEALKEKYGDKKAKTIIGMCSTKISYRCDEPDNSKWLADLYGEEDVQDSKQSVTISDRNDSTNLHDQRSKRHILLPTEFMDLPDKICALKLGRSLPIARVEVPYVPRPDIAKAMILKIDTVSTPGGSDDDYSIATMIDPDEFDPEPIDDPASSTGDDTLERESTEQMPLL